MENEDDFILIQKCLDGDISSFEVIVKKYQLKIINLCNRYTKNYADAEEVAQQSFLRAFNSLDRFRFESKFYTWMHRIAVNCSLNYINSKEKRKEYETITENSGHSYKEIGTVDTETPYNNYNMLKLAAETENIYNLLPEELKLVIKLRYIEDLSYEEISSKTGIPIGTVRSRLHRGRELMMNSLKKFMKDE